ncbi:hypothetical protein A0H81_01434 [Grifola frondosa]|uniref:Uncharacterized protein n=1 Tax=Grifola frondosa TaxID=5627 RepID=A0A1C7MSW1_GRIFR|nr:hypothetical protein A0H81_01434 [Grifola frondosa]
MAHSPPRFSNDLMSLNAVFCACRSRQRWGVDSGDTGNVDDRVLDDVPALDVRGSVIGSDELGHDSEVGAHVYRHARPMRYELKSQPSLSRTPSYLSSPSPQSVPEQQVGRARVREICNAGARNVLAIALARTCMVICRAGFGLWGTSSIGGMPLSTIGGFQRL